MGLAMELLTGFVTAPSTTFTALTMASGNTLTIKNTQSTAAIWLIQAWSDQQTAGNTEIKSPKLHDNVHGIRYFSVASDVKPRLPWGGKQTLYSQDTLVVQQTGSATGGDIESTSLLVWYADLPGQAAMLTTYDYIKARMVNIMGVENTLALGTAGGYSGEEAINAELDFMKANTWYALLGYNVSVECQCIRWRGPDTGNLGVGGPGDELGPQILNDWFCRLNYEYGLPTIPLINSANKASTLIDGAQDENGADTLVSHYYAELKGL